jgi:hypothetical protein
MYVSAQKARRARGNLPVVPMARTFDTLMAEMRRLTSILGFLFILLLSPFSSLCTRGFRPLHFRSARAAAEHLPNVTIERNVTQLTPAPL